MRIKQKKLFGFTVSYTNEEAFQLMKKELLVDKEDTYGEYVLGKDIKQPIIYDLGSNIGLTVLHFKKLYPHAKVVAFEANPRTASILKENVLQNALTDIRIVKAAVTGKGKTEPFFVERDVDQPHGLGDCSKPNAWVDKYLYRKIVVPAVRLSPYLRKKVDLLKMDIEGAETDVLKEAGAAIRNIKIIIVEYHSYRNNTSNSIKDILRMLNQNGFRYEILRKRKKLYPILFWSGLYSAWCKLFNKEDYLMVYARNNFL